MTEFLLSLWLFILNRFLIYEHENSHFLLLSITILIISTCFSTYYLYLDSQLYLTSFVDFCKRCRAIKYQPEYSMWLKRSKAHYQKIIYNNLRTWKASFISFDYLSIENSSTRREQIFSVFNPLEINVFDQTLTKPNFSDFVVQIIWWELKWYMTDLNNVLYFARYSY